MTTHLHRLTGCAPEPLASYLKALGILRVLSEQVDASARGWWEDESFALVTRLDKHALMRFFLEDYAPTPVLAPWNGGSGFYPGDSSVGIDAIRASSASRLADYRQSIAAAERLVEGRSESPKKAEKEKLFARLRETWRGPALEWLDAAAVLDSEGRPTYPALLGTGGNDGRLDFTNNFMQRLAELLDCEHPAAMARPTANTLLGAALWLAPVKGLSKTAVGQFDPGAAGGANGSIGFSSDSRVNPWDFVMMLEGAVAFAPAVTRTAREDQSARAAAPFVVQSAAAGYGSAAEGEKNRGEQWFPLWERPAAYPEIRALIAEGRSRNGGRTAERPVDFGRAIARLGVARGISAFSRFGYIERNGQSNLAVPLGRWTVQERPHVDLLDNVGPWVDRLVRAANHDHAPASIGRAGRACESAMLAVVQNPAPERWRALLIALGDAEAAIPRSPVFAAERRLAPLPPLDVGWVAATAEDSAEFHLAVALAAQHRLLADGRRNRTGGIRRQFLPMDERGRSFAISGERRVAAAEVVAASGRLETDLRSVFRRWLQEAAMEGHPRIPLVPVPGTEARVADLVRFLAGDTDDALILSLCRTLMAVRWPRQFRWPHQAKDSDPAELGAHGLFALAYHRNPIPVSGGEVAVPLDPAPFFRLAAGDLTRAAQSAARRLASAGLRPRIRTAVGPTHLAGRMAAALAFPTSSRTTARLAKAVTRLVDTVTGPQHNNQEQELPTS